MDPLKRRQENTCTPEAPESATAIEWTLPADLLLDIIACSDARTLVRCAATSKLLRRDILSSPFIRRVTCSQQSIVPPCILACLSTPSNMDDASPTCHTRRPVVLS